MCAADRIRRSTATDPDVVANLTGAHILFWKPTNPTTMVTFATLNDYPDNICYSRRPTQHSENDFLSFLMPHSKLLSPLMQDSSQICKPSRAGKPSQACKPSRDLLFFAADPRSLYARFKSIPFFAFLHLSSRTKPPPSSHLFRPGTPFLIHDGFGDRLFNH